MKKVIIYFSLFFTFLTILSSVHAETDITDVYDLKISPIPYDKGVPDKSCPPETDEIYAALNETCASSYEDFLTDPIGKHYWIEDPTITAQGKSNDRARQFLYWVITTNAIDEAPVLREIWNVSSLIALFGVILIAAIFGLGYIISRRTNYDFKIRVWPTLIKLGVMLLYIVLSASIVILLIQLSEVLMKFFIDNLGGRDLFNIYFTTPSQDGLLGATERSYKEFIGGRDLNIRVQEAIQTEIFLLKLTNVTYYVMGVMLLLRKILLWFLLFVSPFLAILMPFILIRNTGWIWIGVFFQWLFYGPLLALFLGATSTIWKSGIPFSFDFSRVSNPVTNPGSFKGEGYVYPTAINIVYGGPGQNDTFGRAINSSNNGNYVDTFAEYVITLVMLWAVTFFPWWLLRIFRDYCCEGIYAMRNILMAMYDQMRAGTPPKGPTPNAPTKGPTSSVKIDTNTPTKTSINVSIGNLETIKNTLSRDLSKSLSLQASKLTDIARLETNKTLKQTVVQNITYLANPVKAEIPAQRQQYMNLRSELFARAIKSDSVAQTILASTSTSETEKRRIREQILQSLPQEISISEVTIQSIKFPKEKVSTITNNYTKSIINNNKTIENIANTTNTSTDQVKNILNSYSQHTSDSPMKVISHIAHETNNSEVTVKNVLAQNGAIGKYVAQVHQTAQKEFIPEKQLTQIMRSLQSITVSSPSAPQGGPPISQHISNTVQIPEQSVKDLISQTYGNLLSQDSLVQEISQQVHVEVPQVKATLETYVNNLDQPSSTVINNISEEQHIDKSTVTNILNTANNIAETTQVTQQNAQAQNITSSQATQIMNMTTETVQEQSQSAPLVQNISSQIEIPEQTIKQLVGNTFAQIITQQPAVQQIASQNNVSTTQVQNILTSYASQIDQPQETIINNISKTENTNQETVTNVIKSTQEILNSSQIVQEQAQKINIPVQQATKIIETVTQPVEATIAKTQPLSAHISTQIEIPEQTIKDLISNVYTSLTTDQPTIEQIASQNNVSTTQVQNILNTYSSQIDQPQETTINNIAQSENISRDTVTNVISTANTVSNTNQITQQEAQKINIPPQQATQIMEIAGQAQPVSVTVPEQSENASQPVVKVISYKSNISEDTSKNIVQNIMNEAVNNEHIVSTVQKETGLQTQQVKNVINTFTQNVTQPTQVIIDKINETSGIPKDQVRAVLSSTADTVLNAHNMVQEVAEKEGIKEEEVARTIQTQMNIVSQPESNIEKTITIPQSISIEDYEQVKEMWSKHYEDGEIPVSERIKSRKDWIEQEIVYITNTLNKILSADEKMRQQGLDELGFLLPIFLINNLKGEELIVYLKAKLEAAKSVQKVISKEEQVKAELGQEEKEEVFVDVEQKKEEPKAMEMTFDEENPAPQSIEDRVQAVQEKISQIEDDSRQAEEPKSIDDIKSRLQEKAENSDVS